MRGLFLYLQSQVWFPLPEWFNQGIDRAKQSVSETVSQLETQTNEFSQTAQKTTESVFNSVFNSVTEFRENTVKTVANFTYNSREWMVSVPDRVQQASQSLELNSTNFWTKSAESAKSWLGNVEPDFREFSQAISELIKNIILSIIPASSKSNLIAVWAIAHPFTALLVLLFLLLVFWGLFTALGNLLAEVWLIVLKFVLKSPVKLCRWLVRISGQKFFDRPQGNYPNQSLFDATKRQADILAKLKSIREEENQLWQEIEQILDMEKSRN